MRNLIFVILNILGFSNLFRLIFQRNKVSILLFHSIGYEAADLAFSYLIKKYSIIPLNLYLEACIKKDKSLLPDFPLVVTFDDGHISNYELLPLFKKYNIRPTVFLCAGITGTKRHFWFNHIPENFTLNDLKKFENKQMLKLFGDFSIYKEFDLPVSLTIEQINEMKPYVDFQSHGIFHPYLPNCDDEEAYIEIFESKKILEQIINNSVDVFCFPNGDYTVRDLKYVKQAGYRCSLTVDFGFNSIHTDLYRLKRFSTNDSDNINEIKVKSSGFWAWLNSIKGVSYGLHKNIG